MIDAERESRLEGSKVCDAVRGFELSTVSPPSDQTIRLPYQYHSEISCCTSSLRSVPLFPLTLFSLHFHAHACLPLPSATGHMTEGDSISRTSRPSSCRSIVSQ